MVARAVATAEEDGCLTMKVSSSTVVKRLSQSIVYAIVESDFPIALQAIGAGALNQAVKAVIVAQGELAPQGISFLVALAFRNVVVEGNMRTAIRIRLTKLTLV